MKKSTVPTRRPLKPVQKLAAKYRKNSGDKRLKPTFPQIHCAHHHHKGDSKTKEAKAKSPVVTGLYPSGNVQKPDKLMKPRELYSAKLCGHFFETVENPMGPVNRHIKSTFDTSPLGENPKQGGNTDEDRASCRRQVYATTEVAKRAVIQLEALGYKPKVERCDLCGLLHVAELKG